MGGWEGGGFCQVHGDCAGAQRSPEAAGHACADSWIRAMDGDRMKSQAPHHPLLNLLSPGLSQCPACILGLA